MIFETSACSVALKAISLGRCIEDKAMLSFHFDPIIMIRNDESRQHQEGACLCSLMNKRDDRLYRVRSRTKGHFKAGICFLSFLRFSEVKRESLQ